MHIETDNVHIIHSNLVLSGAWTIINFRQENLTTSYPRIGVTHSSQISHLELDAFCSSSKLGLPRKNLAVQLWLGFKTTWTGWFQKTQHDVLWLNHSVFEFTKRTPQRQQQQQQQQQYLRLHEIGDIMTFTISALQRSWDSTGIF